MDILFELFKVIVYPGILFIIVFSLLLEWLDRKIYAHSQHRIGPLYIGPHGILQPFADILKLISKEDITPPHVDKPFFVLTPPILLYLAIIGMFMIPLGALGEPYALLSFEGDYLVVLTITTLITAFVFAGSWASFNRFSALGSIRALLLMVGYEIPLFLCAAAVALDAKTLCLSKIALVQSTSLWFIVVQPIGFIISLIALQAELERIPFDIPEAETEIVAGWLTEFSGKKLAMIRLAHDIELFLLASLIVTLYLGGPWGPTGPGALWFILKVMFVILLSSIFRALFARYRIEQAVMFFWKYIIPLSLLQVFIALIIPLI